MCRSTITVWRWIYNGERIRAKAHVFLRAWSWMPLIGTGGGVKIPEEQMRALVQTVDGDCRIIGPMTGRDDLSPDTDVI